MRRLVLTLFGLLAACGRIGFDEQGATSFDTARGMLSVGADHACALHDGGVWCWGDGFSGQLGNGTTGRGLRPSAVPNMSDPISISAGGRHTCTVLDGGAVYCWGANDSQQLGVAAGVGGFAPPPSEILDPGLVTALPGPATEVGTGWSHSCALLADASVWCWGNNESGQLGRGTTSANGELPRAVSGLTGVAHLAITDDSSCALHRDGHVSCWGENGKGQLGTGDLLGRESPTAVVGLVATALTMGGDHTCAIVQGGRFTCWGGNDSGELGGPPGDRRGPTTISVEDDYVQLGAGYRQTCGLHADGAVSCWGDNTNGALGDGTLDNHDNPSPVLNLGTAVHVSTGGVASCALLGDGSIKCWGYGSYGALGTGVGAEPVPQPLGIKADLLGTGFEHACAGQMSAVHCWGLNRSGQLGDGTQIDHTTPKEISRPWGASLVQALDAGDWHTCALVAGEVWCWGQNDYGQTSDPSNSSTLTPIKAPLGMNATSIGVGDNFSCALLTDKTVACWGCNSSGQLGDGTTTETEIPGLVQTASTGTLVNVDELAVGDRIACARSGITIWCWGDNSWGEMGNGSAATMASLADTATITGVTGLFGGGESMCATSAMVPLVQCWGHNPNSLLRGGTVEAETLPITSTEVSPFVLGYNTACTPTGTCWGASGIGQTGTDSFYYSVDPTPLAGPIGPTTTVALSYEFGCATAANSDVYCWGENSAGQLGLGRASRSTLPVTVAFP